MKTPERIWLRKNPIGVPEDDYDIFSAGSKPKFSGETEYIRASLLKSQLKDDKWLADNGLVRVISMADMNLDAIQDMVFDAIEDQE